MIAGYIMEGDWYVFANRCIKVTGMCGNAIYTDIDYTITVVDIVPIPLTPGILERNGFVEKDGLWSISIEGNFINTVSVKFHKFDGCLCDISLHNKMGNIDLHTNFLHELQHAMKLCYIDKEIEL